MRLKRVGVMAQCCSKVNLVSGPDMKGSMHYLTGKVPLVSSDHPRMPTDSGLGLFYGHSFNTFN